MARDRLSRPGRWHGSDALGCLGIDGERALFPAFSVDPKRIEAGVYKEVPDGDPWEHPSDTLYSLCDTCHERAETARASIYLELGRIHPRHHFELRRMLKEVQELIDENPAAMREACAVSGVT